LNNASPDKLLTKNFRLTFSARAASRYNASFHIKFAAGLP